MDIGGSRQLALRRDGPSDANFWEQKTNFRYEVKVKKETIVCRPQICITHIYEMRSTRYILLWFFWLIAFYYQPHRRERGREAKPNPTQPGRRSVGTNLLIPQNLPLAFSRRKIILPQAALKRKKTGTRGIEWLDLGGLARCWQLLFIFLFFYLKGGSSPPKGPRFGGTRKFS